MFPFLVYIFLLGIVLVLFLSSALQVIFGEAQSAKKRARFFGYTIILGLTILIFWIGPQHVTIPDWLFIIGLISFVGIFLYRFRKK